MPTTFATADLAQRLAAFAGVARSADEELLGLCHEVRHALAVFSAGQPAGDTAESVTGPDLMGVVDDLVVFDRAVHQLAEDHWAARDLDVHPTDLVNRLGSPLDGAARSQRAEAGTAPSDDAVVDEFHEWAGEKAGKKAGCRLRAMVVDHPDGSRSMRWRGALGVLDDLWAWSGNGAYVSSFGQVVGLELFSDLENLLAAGHPLAQSDPEQARMEAIQVVQPLLLLDELDPERI